MPYPTKGETKEEYIAKFMESKEARMDYPDQKQRAAVAYSLWEKRNMENSQRQKVGEIDGIQYEIWYEPTKGYYVKSFGKTVDGYFDKQSQAEEHATLSFKNNLMSARERKIILANQGKEIFGTENEKYPNDCCDQYHKDVQKYERGGMSTSDAQAQTDAEHKKKHE